MAALSVLAGYLGDQGNASLVPLQFLSPTVSSVGAQPMYNLSEAVPVSWSTPWDQTTVSVLQGPDDSGSYVSKVIAGESIGQVQSSVAS